MLPYISMGGRGYAGQELLEEFQAKQDLAREVRSRPIWYHDLLICMIRSHGMIWSLDGPRVHASEQRHGVAIETHVDCTGFWTHAPMPTHPCLHAHVRVQRQEVAICMLAYPQAKAVIDEGRHRSASRHFVVACGRRLIGAGRLLLSQSSE